MHKQIKLKPGVFITAFLIIIISFGDKSALSQSNNLNKYGLLIVKDITILQQQIKADPNKEMMDVGKEIPSIVLDLKYTTTQNFMHKKLYPPTSATFLRKPVVDSLKKVVIDLRKMGYGLKIFDAYRPYSITEKMWEKVKDDRYAADPARGSGHNRGVSVDITLIDLKTKKELRMPTGFDNFSDTAHKDFMQLPANILKNRETLKMIMEKYGFIALTTEWWHFYLPNSSDYELLDISFNGLKKLNKRKNKN